MKRKSIIKKALCLILSIIFLFIFTGCAEYFEQRKIEKALDGIIFYDVTGRGSGDNFSRYYVSDYNFKYCPEAISDEVKQLKIKEFYGFEIPECSYTGSSIDEYGMIIHKYKHTFEYGDIDVFAYENANGEIVFSDLKMYHGLPTEYFKQDKIFTAKETEDLGLEIIKKYFHNNDFEIYKYEFRENNNNNNHTDSNKYVHTWNVGKNDFVIALIYITIDSYGNLLNCEINGTDPLLIDELPNITIEQCQERVSEILNVDCENNEKINSVNVVNPQPLATVKRSMLYDEIYLNILFQFEINYTDDTSREVTFRAAIPFAKISDYYEAPEYVKKRNTVK